jgi:hypothetical protein
LPPARHDAGETENDFESAWVTLRPTLLVDHDKGRVGSACVRIRNLDPNLVSFLGTHPQAGHLLRSILRVRVAGPEVQGCEDLPDVLGHYHVLEGGVRFVPYFPFESGLRYRASFDPRPLGCPDHSEMTTLEFSLPIRVNAEPTRVTDVFPSPDALPENLLRFYVRFSNPMQRGRAEEHIRLLGPEGRPATDVLYRPPRELWDRSMRHLTILLDPGRLKRWVGPNRELGPPLKPGQRYTLAIGAGMVDGSDRLLEQGFYKTFLVTDAIRQPIAVAHWKILLPATGSRKPLTIIFPRSLDWALLYRSITIAPWDGPPMQGGITVDQGERQWSFTPTLPWGAGSYSIRVGSDLEDVCGNGLTAAFDRPLRSGSALTIELANCSIPFHLAG